MRPDGLVNSIDNSDIFEISGSDVIFISILLYVKNLSADIVADIKRLTGLHTPKKKRKRSKNLGEQRQEPHRKRSRTLTMSIREGISDGCLTTTSEQEIISSR